MRLKICFISLLLWDYFLFSFKILLDDLLPFRLSFNVCMSDGYLLNSLVSLVSSRLFPLV